ncbi:hypothetical protein ACIQOW_04195 [Kitasatospora sp. NPDC091335]|uniref:hypothetical protein n=1 Tax=Kitasatospora sp. NPDC091335 TaxID=3364085 RepID=UPI0038002F09
MRVTGGLAGDGAQCGGGGVALGGLEGGADEGAQVSGAAGAGPFAGLDLAELATGFDAKFWPQVRVLQAALPYLRADGSVTRPLNRALSQTARTVRPWTFPI